jgi:hypothetical protein
MIDSKFLPGLIKGLFAEPRPPIGGTFGQVTFPVSGNDISRQVGTTSGFSPDVIKCQAGVMDRRAIAIGATVIPTILDGLPPLLFSFLVCKGFHVV